MRYLIIVMSIAIFMTSGRPMFAQRSSDQAIDEFMKRYGLDLPASQRAEEALKRAPATFPKPSQAMAEFIKVATKKVKTTTMPPSDFPVPIFTGAGTNYTVRPKTPYSDGRANLSMNMLTITTSQPVYVIASWYKQALERAGWKLLSLKKTLPTNNSSDIPVPINALKQQAYCFVNFSQLENPKRTMVNINVTTH